MTSLFGVLNNTASNLRMIQGQLSVVAENVASADDPNRSRHVLERTIDASGNPMVAQYRREVDVALRVQLQQTISEESNASTLSSYMRKVTDLLGTTAGTPPLTDSMQKFQAAWMELEATPESTVAQGQIVTYGDDVARELRRLTLGVGDLKREIDTDIQGSVDQLNTALTTIDKLNDDILASKGAGESTMNLEDKRDQLIREVSSLMSVRTVERGDGKLSIFTSSGVSLLDAAPVKFSYSNGMLRSSGSDRALNDQINDGKLGALLQMSADGSTAIPPQPASTQPGAEIIRKLNSQLQGLGEAFLGSTKPGEPTSFADAYNQASPALDHEQANRFFVGNGAGDIQLNPALLSGEKQIKQSAITGVTQSLSASGRSLNADGLRITSVSYSSMVSTVIGSWSTNAKVTHEQATIATDFKSQLDSRYKNNTGVNMDEEIAMLQVLQRNYSAAARVMQTVNNMLDAIEGIVR
ncbi:flagellar hook-associated protein FlgK [Niveispirillum sp. SYP-B3756]|uniref:flagellar hook-associated protein FlgK n=1 Tax=Niveispirillum sp. SYP-B3756 TaxID=2662178 RepID=UPI001292A6EE|nr:flagellar hook-associated protein FlgK [Niveispirillum sp. SYP-B3756]MQP67418.1 flagellar hook-associated protein FlgK [Niveispirillum sp. SYP-B3756]